MVGRKYKITKKDKNFLLVGIIVGMSGGVIGNLMVSSLFALFNSKIIKQQVYAIMLFLSVVSFFGLALWLLNKMEKN